MGERKYFIKIQVCMSDDKDNIRTPINDFWVPFGYDDHEEACCVAENLKSLTDLPKE